MFLTSLSLSLITSSNYSASPIGSTFEHIRSGTFSLPPLLPRATTTSHLNKPPWTGYREEPNSRPLELGELLTLCVTINVTVPAACSENLNIVPRKEISEELGLLE